MNAMRFRENIEMVLSYWACIGIMLLASCATAINNTSGLAGYNLQKADKVIQLPDVLHEVSGITTIDANTVACVQDEEGILFVYNLQRGQLQNKYPFNVPGDYEGIARVNDTMYILQSDGTLYELPGYELRNFQMKAYITGIPANNNEGLCYDSANHRLLIASKSKPGKNKQDKDRREIYSFDLHTKQLSTQPVYEFSVAAIKEFALKNNITLPYKKNNSGTDAELKYKPSAICIHPITKKLFQLSASDYLLFVFDTTGQLEHVTPLNKEMFNKAEGITFLPNGDMLITNEGQDKRPTLLLFKYHPDTISTK